MSARKELSLVHTHTGMCIRCCCFFLPKGNEKIRNTSGKYVCVLWWWETATNNNTTSSCRSQQPTDCGTRHAEPNPGSGRSIIFFFRSHCGARNVKLEYISVGYSKTRDPTKAVTHTHTNIHTHTHTIPVALVTILPLGLLSY